MEFENANPTRFEKCSERQVLLDEEDNDIVDDIDSREVFGERYLGELCAILPKSCILKDI